MQPGIFKKQLPAVLIGLSILAAPLRSVQATQPDLGGTTPVTPPTAIASPVSDFGVVETPTGISGRVSGFGGGLGRTGSSAYADWPTANIGGAELPAHFVTLLVTQGGAVQVLIDAIQSEPYASIIRPYPRQHAPDLPGALPIARATVDMPIKLPEAPVFVQSEGQAGSKHIASIALSPVFSQSGEVRLATSISYRVNGVSYLFSDSANPTDAEQSNLANLATFGAESPASSPSGSGLARAVAQDASFACTNNLPQPMQPFLASVSNVPMRANIWRISVSNPGIQRLDIGSLPAAPGGNSALYQVWRGGHQVPLDISGGQMRFYAPVAGDRFNTTSTYWLVVDNGAGLRMAASGTVPAPSPRTTAYELGAWRETKLYYPKYAGAAGDHWYSANVVAPSDPSIRDYPFTIANVLPAVGPTTVSVDAVRQNIHTYSVSVFVGLSIATFTGSGLGNWTMPDAALTSTSSAGTIHVNNPPVAGEIEQLLVQRVRWSRLVNLSFFATSPGVRLHTLAGASSYRLANLPTGSSVYDVTDPASPTVVSMVGADFQSPGDRDYFVMIPSTVAFPTVAKYGNWEDLATPRAGNAVYIAHASLLGPVEPLRKLRQDQGYKPQIVPVDRLYDWYGTGDLDAESIRNFLRYAYATWSVKPIAVTLVGDSSYDPLNRLTRDFDWNTGLYDVDYVNSTYVPTYLANVDSEVGEADCDTCFVRWSCDAIYDLGNGSIDYDALPDAYIGRLSAINTTQLTTVVGKIISYESSFDNGAWRTQQRYFADNLDLTPDSAGDFAAANEQIIQRQPAGTQIGRLNYVIPPSATDGGALAARVFQSQVSPLLSQGQGIAVYSGHGNWPVWADPVLYNIDNPDTINNNGRMPFMLEFTCATSWIDRPMPNGASLDEKFHRNANSAMAVWGSSGWDNIQDHNRLAFGLFGKLWANTTADQSQPIGALVNAAYIGAQAAIKGDSMNTYILLGDPLTKLRVNRPHATPGNIAMGTIAGHADASPGNNDAQGRSAGFRSPTRVAVSPDGVVSYVSDTGNHTVRKINLTTGVVTTLAGMAGTPGAQNGLIGTSQLNNPAGLAVSPDGQYVYVADTGNNAIRRVDVKTTEVTTIASGLSGPSGLAASWDGVAVYFTEPLAHRLRRVLVDSNEIQDVASGGLLNAPDGVSIPGNGTFALVADTAGNAILKIDLTASPFVVSTVIASSKGLNQPHGVALTADGRYAYVADTGNQVIRRINVAANQMATVSGLVGATGRADGQGADARYNFPVDVTVNLSQDRIVVGDSSNNLVRYANIQASKNGLYLPVVKR